VYLFWKNKQTILGRCNQSITVWGNYTDNEKEIIGETKKYLSQRFFTQSSVVAWAKKEML
jgi:hypothetical protein